MIRDRLFRMLHTTGWWAREIGEPIRAISLRQDQLTVAIGEAGFTPFLSRAACGVSVVY